MEIPYIVEPRKDTGLFNSKVGIWLFLASEVMLFGGLFSGYVFLRLGADYPWPERTLPVMPGLINTFILIASSVTVVFAWASLKMRKWAQFQVFMGITVLCAVVFMCFKALEYGVKFKHQAVRMNDFTVVEGHLGYLPEGGHKHGEHGGAAGDVVLAEDREGNHIEENTVNFEVETVSFDITRYHKPWIEDLVFAAEQVGGAIELAETIDFNRKDADAASKNADAVFDAGTPLSFELLANIQQVHLDHRARNAGWRTEAIRESWKEVRAKPENQLSEANFAAEFPKGPTLEGRERDRAFKRWKSGKRSRLAEQVSIDGIVIDGMTYEQFELPEWPTVTFKFTRPAVVRHGSHDVITDFTADATQLRLRDGSVLGGRAQASPAIFHDADAVDFQHLAMDAEAKDQDPLVAIENSWIIRHNPEIATMWKMHQEGVRQLEEVLAEEGREPTEKDRYRMGWQELAYYGKLIDEAGGHENVNLADVKIDPSTRKPPHVKARMSEQFRGPDYSTRHFPEISVPREQILLDSKFTPKWNTYYAIYFTITGLHGLHVVGGAIVLAYYLFFSKGMYLANPEWLANRVEVGGLFWHFVDLVWIFAFPIFYLM